MPCFPHKLQHSDRAKDWLILKRNLPNKQWHSLLDDEQYHLQWGRLHSSECWHQTQIVARSTSQHGATWWSDWRLLRKEGGAWSSAQNTLQHSWWVTPLTLMTNASPHGPFMDSTILLTAHVQDQQEAVHKQEHWGFHSPDCMFSLSNQVGSVQQEWMLGWT